MKIVKFEAENIKKLRVVEITPQGNIVQLTGPNGAGKSSILDSIWYALGGTQNIPDVPLRKGAKKGHVTLDLGELVVTRKFSEGGSTELRVESKDGERLKSPQQILDKLTGSLTFDPLAFSRMKPAAMLEELRKLVKLDVDIDALDRDSEKDYSTRTDLNKAAKALHAQADGIFFPERTPDDEVDVSALLAQMQQVSQANSQIDQQVFQRQQEAQSIASLREKAVQRRRDAEQLRQQAKQIIDRANGIESDAASVDATADEHQAKLDALDPIPPKSDPSEISQKIQQAQASNRFIGLKKQKSTLKANAKEHEDAAVKLTRQIERRDEQKSEAIASAKMPIDGLSFGNGQVLFNGIPFEQASSAEQLRVSTAIAIAMNPKLRVIRIQDGSLLDQGNMEALAQMAEQNDMQIWIERVTGIGNAAVVIDSGEIVS